MHFTPEEVSDLALNQLAAQELIYAYQALNGLADDFGKSWVDALFLNGIRSPLYVRYLVVIWEDWCLVKPLPGSEKLHQRWKHGIQEHGVLQEVYVLARMKGLGVDIQLCSDVVDQTLSCAILPCSGAAN